MQFYRAFFYIFLLVLCLGCSSDDEDGNIEPSITITSFVAGKNEVEISWELARDNNVIIEDLLIYRETFSDGSERRYFELIESIPSSSKSYIDTNVPYLSKISYYVKANYRYDDDDQYEILSLQSEEKVFERDFPQFDQVPYQVMKDPDSNDIYHILTNWNPAEINRYDARVNEMVQSRTFSESLFYGTRFIFSGNDLVLGDLKGNFFFVDKESYEINRLFDADLQEDLEGFGIIGNRLYYVEDFSFDYINVDTGAIKKHGTGKGFKYFQVLNETQLLSLYSGTHSSAASVYEFQDDLDPDIGWDFSLSEIRRTSPELNLDGNDVDTFIFTWSNDKTQFLTGIEGRFFNINDLTPGIVLGGITGKRYLHFAIDSKGDIYGSVQEEKIIHVFDGETLELKESIPTKLYPVFPIITTNGLVCIGAYERVEYWGYNYGIDYGFHSEAAIETF
ncbi:hypothetical protein AB1A65_14560 [Muricauda sp. ANG21]|uniref:hypothetical protein n=1 Tax=Allomuricauda sp. ANG21 TaxID=3042468 RepID=UPI00345365AF